ncbi:MAG: undecaprenyl-diphosphate phosphatase [Acidimicrobiia bacterium]|nr:undecaprenyl-diphosphate phosphatase [Acidimicrobiia bacterium]
MSRRRPIPARSALLGVVLAIVLVAVGPLGVGRTSGAAEAEATPDPTPEASDELSIPQALVLGVVEGVTEYLPISSTGHLLVAERMMGVGQTEQTKDAINSYTVVIQVGAILAVLLLFRSRVAQLLAGLVGRDEQGRQLLIRLVLAFLPAAIVGLALGDVIESKLLATGPVVVAWIVGGIGILAVAHRFRDAESGVPLEALGNREALIIGCAQALALWPGVSRSLVTIVAALLVGMSLAAAVEFSFILGLATLGAATVFALSRSGGEIVDVFGWTSPLVGVAAALVSALVAVKWMVGYLQRHDLSVFGWYRIAAGLVTVALLVTGAI